MRDVVVIGVGLAVVCSPRRRRRASECHLITKGVGGGIQLGTGTVDIPALRPRPDRFSRR